MIQRNLTRRIQTLERFTAEKRKRMEQAKRLESTLYKRGLHGILIEGWAIAIRPERLDEMIAEGKRSGRACALSSDEREAVAESLESVSRKHYGKTWSELVTLPRAEAEAIFRKDRERIDRCTLEPKDSYKPCRR